MTLVRDGKKDVVQRYLLQGGSVVGEREWAQLQIQEGKGGSVGEEQRRDRCMEHY